MRVKLRGALFHCACGKSYSNPLGHVCTTGRDFKRRGAAHTKSTAAAAAREKKSAARAKETAARRARRQQEDEARRARRAKETTAARKRKAPASRPEHPLPRACRDGDCMRTGCRSYREGRTDGYDEGHEIGYEQGFDAGIIACPRPHEST